MYSNLVSGIKEKTEKIAVVGLGYVGLPLAISFAQKVEVVGFDINIEKIQQYKFGIDVTKEVGEKKLKETKMVFTNDPWKIKECKFVIIAVPTPVSKDNTPNLDAVTSASKIVGKNLSKGSIVVYESTVYPGVTEDICVPILEEESGLKCGVDFKVGYSPERINPGDKEHTLETIVKIVSGMDEESLNIIADVYSIVVTAGVYKAESIKIAEAAKVIENAQRDINIAFINELSLIFNKIKIDTLSVLRAAGTKWNFLNFKPGLVGGHCIGVDPFYLTYMAEKAGYHSEVILSGRRINDNMGKHVAENTIKNLIKANKQVNGSRILIVGVTFKENVPDIRNSKVIDIISELKEYGVEVLVVDDLVDKSDFLNEYGLETVEFEDVKDIDCVIFAVPHKEYFDIDLNALKSCFKDDNYLMTDIKGMFDKNTVIAHGYSYWRL